MSSVCILFWPPLPTPHPHRNLRVSFKDSWSGHRGPSLVHQTVTISGRAACQFQPIGMSVPAQQSQSRTCICQTCSISADTLHHHHDDKLAFGSVVPPFYTSEADLTPPVSQKACGIAQRPASSIISWGKLKSNTGSHSPNRRMIRKHVYIQKSSENFVRSCGTGIADCNNICIPRVHPNPPYSDPSCDIVHLWLLRTTSPCLHARQCMYNAMAKRSKKKKKKKINSIEGSLSMVSQPAAS